MAYGPSLPWRQKGAIDLTSLRTALPVVAEVRADCRCGHDHGEDGASSCGRYWVVNVHAAEDDDE